MAKNNRVLAGFYFFDIMSCRGHDCLWGGAIG